MAELRATNEYTRDTVTMNVEDADLDLSTARDMAKTKARDIDSNAMMLSYHSGKTGEFWPTYDCGGGGRPIVFAEARGYNLKIDINDGEYEFFYLRF